MQDTITCREILMSLIAICGELPFEQIDRLEGGNRYKYELLRDMKKRKQIKTFYKDRMRGYRLLDEGKRHLLASNPERFSFYLTGSSETNHIRSEVTRRHRLHRTAETWITMLNADVEIFRDRKTNIFSPKWRGDDVRLPAFYSSLEIKEMGEDMTKIGSSRATGVLLTDEHIYPTYALGDSLIKWPYKAENRFKTMMQSHLCHDRLPSRYVRDNISGLILANSMYLAGEILGPSNLGSYFLLNGGYEHFYYLTNDRYGERILQLFCDTELRASLDSLLSEDLAPCNPLLAVENDGIDENGVPVLFAYTCDLPRLRRFNIAVAIRQARGTVICFDFQKEVLERVLNKNIHFQMIDFEKWERIFFEET